MSLLNIKNAFRLILFLFMTLPQLVFAESKFKVSTYGKVLKDEDIVVEFVTVDGKNDAGLSDVLLRFSGTPAHEAGIDKQVMLYKAVRSGTGEDYTYQDEAGTRTRMISRLFGYEVYLNNKTYKVWQDDKATKTLKTQALLEDYLKNSKK